MATLDLLEANDNLSELQKADNAKNALEEIQSENFYGTLNLTTHTENQIINLITCHMLIC